MSCLGSMRVVTVNDRMRENIADCSLKYKLIERVVGYEMVWAHGENE